jgi:hypothetical protein
LKKAGDEGVIVDSLVGFEEFVLRGLCYELLEK